MPPVTLALEPGQCFWGGCPAKRGLVNNSFDDEDIILAEVAVEAKAGKRSSVFSDYVSKSHQGNGVRSSTSSSFRRSLQVGGKGDFGHESSSFMANDLVFGDAIAVGYSPAELHEVGFLPGKSKKGVGGGRPWMGPLPPPRLSPPLTVGDAIDLARRGPPVRPRCSRKFGVAPFAAAEHGSQVSVDWPKLVPDSVDVQNSNDVLGFHVLSVAKGLDGAECLGPSPSGVVAGLAPSEPIRRSSLPWLRKLFGRSWDR